MLIYLFARVDRKNFWYLHDCIKRNPVFVSRSLRPQRPPWYQLAAFLIRYGCDPAIKTAETACMSEGSVYNYCTRVAQAFRDIRHEHLSWPGPQRRTFLKSEMAEYGFPGCIGIVDGTLIELMQKPRRHGEVYFCRKKYYAVSFVIYYFSLTCCHY